jgi:hypothetical protein
MERTLAFISQNVEANVPHIIILMYRCGLDVFIYHPNYPPVLIIPHENTDRINLSYRELSLLKDMEYHLRKLIHVSKCAFVAYPETTKSQLFFNSYDDYPLGWAPVPSYPKYKDTGYLRIACLVGNMESARPDLMFSEIVMDAMFDREYLAEYSEFCFARCTIANEKVLFDSPYFADNESNNYTDTTIPGYVHDCQMQEQCCSLEVLSASALQSQANVNNSRGTDLTFDYWYNPNNDIVMKEAPLDAASNDPPTIDLNGKVSDEEMEWLENLAAENPFDAVSCEVGKVDFNLVPVETNDWISPLLCKESYDWNRNYTDEIEADLTAVYTTEENEKRWQEYLSSFEDISDYYVYTSKLTKEVIA